jgi:hypothetical protein
MTIGIKFLAAGTAIYFAHQILGSSQYGYALPNIASGFVLGMVAGTAILGLKNLPNKMPQATLLCATALAGLELTKNAISTPHTNISGLMFIASAFMGLLQVSNGDLRQFGIA